jgi:flagellar hook-length control protein FliK
MKLFPKNYLQNASISKPKPFTKISLSEIKNDFQRSTFYNQADEIRLPANELSEMLKSNKVQVVKELRQFIRDIDGNDVKIKFVKEPERNETTTQKFREITKPSHAKGTAEKINAPKVNTEDSQSKFNRGDIKNNSIETNTQNILARSSRNPLEEIPGKTIKMEFKQFKSAIRINSINQNLKTLFKTFEQYPEVKIEIKSAQLPKTANVKETNIRTGENFEVKNDNQPQLDERVDKKISYQKPNNKPVEKTTSARAEIEVRNDKSNRHEVITKKQNDNVKVENTNHEKIIDANEKSIKNNEIIPKITKQNAVKESEGKKEVSFAKYADNEKIETMPKKQYVDQSTAKISKEKPAGTNNPTENRNSESNSEKIRFESEVASKTLQDKKINTTSFDLRSDAKNEEPVSDNKTADGNLKNDSRDGSTANSKMNSNQNNNESAYANDKGKAPINNGSEDDAIPQKLGPAGQIDSAEIKNHKSEIANFNKHFPEFEKTIKVTELYDEISKIVNRKEKQSVTLQLVPKELGKVKILIDIVDNIIQAKIEVDSETAKLLIQNNIEHLRHSLNQSGILLNSYSISMTNQNERNLRSQNAKKKFAERDKIKNNENESKPVSGKALGYNTYEYLI